MVELHVEGGEPVVEAERHAVVDFVVILVEITVLDYELVGLAESEERTELQCGGRVCVDERVADQYSVFLRDEYHLLGKDNSSYTIGSARNAFAVIFTNVLVSFRTVYTTGVPV